VKDDVIEPAMQKSPARDLARASCTIFSDCAL
jgi:hypothetical protein